MMNNLRAHPTKEAEYQTLKTRRIAYHIFPFHLTLNVHCSINPSSVGATPYHLPSEAVRAPKASDAPMLQEPLSNNLITSGSRVSGMQHQLQRIAEGLPAGAQRNPTRPELIHQLASPAILLLNLPRA
ncbi:hypothetical protein EWB00_001073 [Schistosoma japonicum]|uniref:Uncharacterized protein n=1 Tax=Schistosoma japonicum TaxID=6182 RepID=A0A4Z2CK72_SCHJA|nr:hypothetical protein EWB00_001073 [Schistosoma japonicum]